MRIIIDNPMLWSTKIGVSLDGVFSNEIIIKRIEDLLMKESIIANIKIEK